LKREFGRHATQLACFENSRTNLLESEFSYRLVKLLRDCALHGGLPLVEVSITSRAAGEPGASIARDLRILVDREELLTKVGRRSGPLRQRIGGLPEKFPIDAYLDDVLKRLLQLNLDVLSVTLPELVASAELLRSLANECREFHGFPVVLRYKSATSNELRLDMEMFPLHLATPILDSFRR